MDNLPTRAEIYARIKTASKVVLDELHAVYEAFVESELEKARQADPTMDDLTVDGYFEWMRTDFQQQKVCEATEPWVTPEQFWNAAYIYDHEKAYIPSEPRTQLYKYLVQGNRQPLPLGKLFGWSDARYELYPDVTALPASDDDDCPSLPNSKSTSSAIDYPEGHPSEFEEPKMTCRSVDDQKLYRMLTLGGVLQVESDGSRNKTRHMLILDMAEGRDHHPWIVLASQADKKVEPNDYSQPGVLPGGKNRTPVAKIIPLDKSSKGPVLLQLGFDFEFNFETFGSDKLHPEAKYGPDLAYVMDWYWDPKTNEEVCFREDLKECMRHNPLTKLYTYPSQGDSVTPDT
ncbi:MAG: hypothetical protein Q9218_002516 [Villophora microphyllina]